MRKDSIKYNKITSKFLLLLSCACFIFYSCAGVDPRKVDVELKESHPTTYVTFLHEALSEFGIMTSIYGTGILRVQCEDISDNTGTSISTGGEIPRDITEMIKSTLNALGGNIIYIPYKPAFIQNQIATGYLISGQRIIPDVVITGGITEFDRGLETKEENTEFGVETKPFSHAPKWFPGKTLALDNSDKQKEGLASISIDFNLIDLQTMSGIPRVQTVNTIKVSKAMREKELAFTLFGPTFGLKGVIKKVQGRHAAIRLLVQVSMIQIIGKYLALPYWRLLPDAEPDPVVMDKMATYFNSADNFTKTLKVQELLFIHGYDVPLNGIMDDKTALALFNFDSNHDPLNNVVSKDTFFKLYLTLPIDETGIRRRELYLKMLAQNTVQDRVVPGGSPAQPEQDETASQENQQSSFESAIDRLLLMLSKKKRE